MDSWHPYRKVTTNGLFSYEEFVTPQTPTNNPWAAQRNADGSPHTVIGHSNLRPPTAGPKLIVGDVQKGVASSPTKEDKDEDTPSPDAIVKSYLFG